MSGWIGNLKRVLFEPDYADARSEDIVTGNSALSETDILQGKLPHLRSLYDGTVLQEKSNKKGSKDAPLKYPVQVDMIGTYCRAHAMMLFGRGQTGRDRENIVTVRANPKIPGKKPYTAMADRMQEELNYFIDAQTTILRENAVIQQWAGGCALKVSWQPNNPLSVWGIVLETIQPEHFMPIWDPTNFRSLMGAVSHFRVGKEVARFKYGLSEEEARELSREKGDVLVEEYWDREIFQVVLGRDTKVDGGIVGRWPSGQPMEGKNPWQHPRFEIGMVPFVYIPRFRDGSFYGVSIAEKLEGLQQEFNKSMADYGDALNRASHPSGGISDYHGKMFAGQGSEVVAVPKGSLVFLGNTVGGTVPPKVHEFPKAEIPSQTEHFTDSLVATSDFVAGLTPAAKGVVNGQPSALAMAASMLPTINSVDWQRDHWNDGLCKGQGIFTIAQAIWLSKPGYAKRGMVPNVKESQFDISLNAEFRPILPRDRAEVIDEVVKLATAQAVSPQEWLRRLGDLPDEEEEFLRLKEFMIFMAQKESAVAGREIEVSQPKTAQGQSGKVAPEGYPQIVGKTDVPSATKMPARQPQGQKPGSNGSRA